MDKICVSLNDKNYVNKLGIEYEIIFLVLELIEIVLYCEKKNLFFF